MCAHTATTSPPLSPLPCNAAALPDSSTAAPPRCSVVFSFNGGKDSTVVLHLLRAVLAERHPLPAAPPTPLLGGLVPAVYFAAAGEFPPVLAFMAECEARYGFATRHVAEFKAGIAQLREGGARAVLMGTRRTDPHGGALQHFTPTTLNWPPMMRVCPVLNWTYRMVWAFLRATAAPAPAAPLPYCTLYDAGYTSLGSVADSVPNPSLARPPVAGGGFMPAYMLGDDALERAGRNRGSGAPPAVHAGLRQPQAAILIVGDEVLSGRVRDANSPYLAAHLTARGLAVAEIATVPDDTAAIASAVRRLSSSHDYVLSCGGLGPTHDDVTMRGIADAFRYPLRACPHMTAFLTALFHDTHRGADAPPASDAVAGGGRGDAAGSSPLDVFLRMAALPRAVDVRLHFADGSQEPAFADVDGGTAPPRVETDALLSRGYPLVQVRNVWVFPGVPAIVRRKFRAHAHLFTGGSAAVTELLRIPGANEPQIAPHLEALLREWRTSTITAPAAQGHADGDVRTLPMSGVKLGSYLDDDDPFAAVHLAGHRGGRGGGGGGSGGSVVSSPAITPVAGSASGADAATALAAPPILSLPAAEGGGGGSGVTVSITAVGEGAADVVAAAVAAIKRRLV
jgi:molybdenum cofactor synthesis domain-containing protein